MDRKVIYIHILETPWLLAFVDGRQCVPEALAQARSVTLSLAFLKLAALVFPAMFKDVEGVNRYHNPVSSAL